MSDLFGILESEFRRSFKQILPDTTGPAVSREEMIVGHHVEIVVSTRWLVAYMIMHMPPKGGIGSDTREAAATLLKSFFAACAASATTSLSTSPADLPRCMAGNTNAVGACRHVVVGSDLAVVKEALQRDLQVGARDLLVAVLVQPAASATMCMKRRKARQPGGSTQWKGNHPRPQTEDAAGHLATHAAGRRTC